MTGEQDPAAVHWDDAYAQGDATRSWFQDRPLMSLRMLDAAGVGAADSLIDVGGGASPLAGILLLERGFCDVTVLDVSAAGMRYARQRLGARAGRIQWVTADIRTWRPRRQYRAWHDRAVFHFLTTAPDREQYRRALNVATTMNAVAVFGCFAPDGPPRCSGLPVARYDPRELADQVGGDWELIVHDHEAHTTPAGAIQPFTWVALRRLR